MAVPNTGQVGLSDIAAEFGGSVPHELSEYYAGGGLVPATASGNQGTVPSSGQISIDDLRGAEAAAPITATGGSVSDSGGWRYHTFTSPGTFCITGTAAGPFCGCIQTMVLAGGGSNPTGGNYKPGGAGGGGMLNSPFSATVTNYPVTVGGAAANSNTPAIGTACRGGCGGNAPSGGQPGGSGGGGGTTFFGIGGAAGAGISGQGCPGGTSTKQRSGSGGGGTQNPGTNTQPHPTLQSCAGQGGSGRVWCNGVRYGGGGGGFSENLSSPSPDRGHFISCSGAGGAGGGGYGLSGNANFYGGGAGGQCSSSTPTVGYQGLVIFRYRCA